MIEHIVLFRFKDQLGASEWDAIQQALLALKAKIPAIVDLSVGRNFSERAQGFDAGLVVRFRDRAGLGLYADHPEHRAVVENKIKPAMASVLAVDYEF